MLKKNLLAICLSLFLLGNVFSAPEPLIFQQKDTIISLPANQSEFSIQLKSNPSTGYSWFLRDFDRNLITPVKRQYIAPNKKLMGAPGFELWTFKIKPEAFIVPQQLEIKMLYARPNDKSDNTSTTFYILTSH